MDNTIKGSDVGSSTCKMEMDESVSDSVGHGRIEIVRKHSNKVFPFPTTLASNEMKCENEKHNGTSANDNKETEKLQSLEDQHLERGENNTHSQLSKRSSLPSISSKVTDDESCLRVIKRNLCAFPGHCWKVLRCKESLFPKRDVKPRELTPKQATKIIVLRLLMILHTCLSIWRVAVEKNNQLFWIFTLMIPLQILEGVYSLRRDRRIRKR